MVTTRPVEEVVERVARWARASRGKVLWSGEVGILVMFDHAGVDDSNPSNQGARVAVECFRGIDNSLVRCLVVPFPAVMVFPPSIWAPWRRAVPPKVLERRVRQLHDDVRSCVMEAGPGPADSPS